MGYPFRIRLHRVEENYLWTSYFQFQTDMSVHWIGTQRFDYFTGGPGQSVVKRRTVGKHCWNPDPASFRLGWWLGVSAKHAKMKSLPQIVFVVVIVPAISTVSWHLCLHFTQKSCHAERPLQVYGAYDVYYGQHGHAYTLYN